MRRRARETLCLQGFLATRRRAGDRTGDGSPWLDGVGLLVPGGSRPQPYRQVYGGCPRCDQLTGSLPSGHPVVEGWRCRDLSLLSLSPGPRAPQPLAPPIRPPSPRGASPRRSTGFLGPPGAIPVRGVSHPGGTTDTPESNLSGLLAIPPTGSVRWLPQQNRGRGTNAQAVGLRTGTSQGKQRERQRRLASATARHYRDSSQRPARQPQDAHPERPPPTN